MKDWIITIVGTIIFFGVNVLLDYLYNKSVDWKSAIIFSITFAIIEALCQIYRNKKSNK